MKTNEKKDKIKLDEMTFPAPHNGYAPAEDSWLLAQAIEKQAKNVNEKKCLDMGCGNGIQTAALLANGAAHVTCVDVNPDALRTTRTIVGKYFGSQKQTTRYVSSFLFENVNKETFDVVVFNPPYVPSEKIKWAEVDGGKKGREIIDAFLDTLNTHLEKNGFCLLLQSSLNSLYLSKKKCAEKKMKCRIIARQKIAFEELYVLKISFK